MEWRYSDGGRSEAGYIGRAGDCVVRAIAIAMELPYQQVYELANVLRSNERGKHKSSARNGIKMTSTRKLIAKLGWQWIPTMQIGSGCKVHLKTDELPTGRLIVKLSRHIATVVNGVVYDTCDPTRNETRCVYGYWRKP